MAYCPNCGREGDKFCSFCGSKLFEESNKEVPAKYPKPKIAFIVLSLLFFAAGVILYGIYCSRPEGKVYLRYAGVSALIYAATLIGLSFVPV
ncbi:MAG TPA: hypothetical protein VIL23_02150 [Clostridia bacterium]